MSVYTGIRFKGVVNKEYRSTFKDIAVDGRWEIYAFEPFSSFYEENYSSSICINGSPFVYGVWEDDKDFRGEWDTETGYWCFQTIINHADDIIEDFIKLLPELMESLEYLEIWCEIYERSDIYIMEDGKIIYDTSKNYK